MEIIDFQGSKVPATYLGDGVYTIFDGYGIWLHANDHKNPTDKVYLEPSVMEALKRFEKDLMSCEKKDEGKEPENLARTNYK